MARLRFLACLLISLSSLRETTAFQNDEHHQSGTRDFSTILEVVEKLEKRVDALEAENAQQRVEIAELKAFVEREKNDKPSSEDRVAPVDDISTDKGHTAARDRDTERRDVNRIRQVDPETTVAFYASLRTHAEHLGQKQNIHFDNVVTNVGNAYDHNSGMFKAPLAGVYVFSTTIMTLNRNITTCGFALNDQHMTSMYLSGNENVHDSDSQTIVLQLRPGDDVSVQHYDTDKSLYGGNYAVFSGFLLKSTQDGASIIG